SSYHLPCLSTDSLTFCNFIVAFRNSLGHESQVPIRPTIRHVEEGAGNERYRHIAAPGRIEAGKRAGGGKRDPLERRERGVSASPHRVARRRDRAAAADSAGRREAPRA